MEKITFKINKDFSDKLKHNLVFGDTLGVLPTIPDNYADHCITDPPYSLAGYDGKKKIGWLQSNKYWTESKKFSIMDEKWDKFTNDEYDKFTLTWLKEILRIVKENGNIVIFGTYHNIFRIGNILQKLDIRIINMIVWYKRNAFPNITQRMLCESTEYAIWAVNNTSKKAKNWTFNYKDLKKMNPIKVCSNCKKTMNIEYIYCPFCGKNDFRIKNVQMRNMWDIPSTPTNERQHGKHPSQKPEKLIEKIILGGSKEGDIIIDHFMGSGTIPVVANLHNRGFIGIDNVKEYCEIAKKRLESARQSKLNF